MFQGSLESISNAVDRAIDETRPIGINPDHIKLELALEWLDDIRTGHEGILWRGSVWLLRTIWEHGV